MVRKVYRMEPMRWCRWIAQPRLLAGLTLLVALVPAWLAVVTYRDARQKDERVFETTADVLGRHLRDMFERDAYIPREVRIRAAALDDDSLRKGKMNPTFPWMEKMPPLLAMGYAEWVDGKLIVRWKSAERVPVVQIGDDLTAIPGVVAALKVPQTDRSPVAGCVTAQRWMILLLPLSGIEKESAPRGCIVAWIDLNLSCRDISAQLIRDEVLSATPLVGDEPVRAETRRVEVRILGAAWTAEIARGARFSLQYGAPPPWFTFIAVGLSAVPLLVLASFAGRSAKLRAALTAEQEVASQQRFFTQSVSHEFRTPLGIILSGAELLDRYADRLTPERRSEVLAEIKDNTRLMTEMVEGVLLLGRIESGKFACTRHSVDLAEFSQGVVRKVSATAAGAAISVSAPTGEVMVDAAVLGSILENLLSNAVKYSPRGKAVSLSVVAETERLIFTVRDEGIGMPATEIPRVCDPFHRCKNVGDIPGTGLGLAIARRCAELHGGTLHIESAEGRGTTVKVTISTQ